ncbi:MAG: hypothetical protein J6V88_02500 [Kiritimatiellae bacterium]|nr:hypothetical protein [Kiritimatiellia bacterium]
MKILVTAGPTREHIDPVRFLSNPSTGKMGFSIAAVAQQAGHDVTLVTGPVFLRTPVGVNRIDVVSAREMQSRVIEQFPNFDVLVMTAAVADWRPQNKSSTKLKKGEMSDTLKLVRNPDILKSVKKLNDVFAGEAKYRKFVVGFAAETGAPVEEAARKCKEKGLDFVVGNDVTEKGCGFGTNTNKVVFVFPDGNVKQFPLLSKISVARKILEEITNQLAKNAKNGKIKL